MNPKKLEKGDRFYHPALNTLLACRDSNFNLVYNEEDLKQFENGGIKCYLPNNSGRFYSTDYVYCNDWKVFEVIKSELGGGGSGQGVNDIYPDAWQVFCKPVGVETVIIHFNQLTNCMAYTIPEVMSVDDDIPIITPEGCICVGTKNGESTCYTLTEWETMNKIYSKEDMINFAKFVYGRFSVTEKVLEIWNKIIKNDKIKRIKNR